MKYPLLFGAHALMAVSASLSDICNTSNIKSSLPGGSDFQGFVFGAVTAQPVYNSSVEAGNNYPAASGRNFCNVTVAYKHAGKDDTVLIQRTLRQRYFQLLIHSERSDQRLVLFP